MGSNKQAEKQDNFIYLTIALVFLLFIGAMAEHYSLVGSYRVLQSATVVTIGLGVWSVRSKLLWFKTGVGFFVAILGVTLAGLVFDSIGLQYAHLSIMLAFFLLTAWEAMRQMLFSGPVNRNKIIGSLCLYLLLGIIWALMYIFLEMLQPGSFVNLIVEDHWHQHFNDFIYFSYVTLTTLGFGDVAPLTPLAKFLVVMEAIIGQFYIAILVASLIGVRVASMREEH